MNGEELEWSAKFRTRLPAWAQAWEALYAGLLIADDIEALAERLEKTAGSLTRMRSGPFVLAAGGFKSIDGCLGNHTDLGKPLPDKLRDALDQSLAGDERQRRLALAEITRRRGQSI
jgi:hypothetical protein